MVKTCSPANKKELRDPWKDLSGPSGIHLPTKIASLSKAHRLLISTADKLSRCPPFVYPHIPNTVVKGAPSAIPKFTRQAHDFESGFFGAAVGRPVGWTVGGSPARSGFFTNPNQGANSSETSKKYSTR